MCPFKERFVQKQRLLSPGFLLQRWHICHIPSLLPFHDISRLSPIGGHWSSTLKFKNVKRINRAQSCRLPECRLLRFLPLKVNGIGNVVFLWASKPIACIGFILQYRQSLKLFLDVKKGFVALVAWCWFPHPGAHPPECHLEWEGDFTSAGFGWGVLKQYDTVRLDQSWLCHVIPRPGVWFILPLCNPALSAGSALSQENQGDLGATCCSPRSVCEVLPNTVCACVSTRGARPCPGV